MTSFRLARLDAIEYLRSLSDASVDMISVDVAYESLEKWRKMGTTTRLKKSTQSSNEWFAIFPNDRFRDLFVEMYRVLKKDRHLYFFSDAETMFVAKPIGVDVGFRFRKPLVWDKMSTGMGYSYRAGYEFVLYFEKGKRRLNDLGIRDVLPVKRLKGADLYPTEKPVELNEIFVKQSTQPGEVVCDPFMGSGSAGVAAIKNGRLFWGNDLAETACVRARGRLLAAGGVEEI